MRSAEGVGEQPTSTLRPDGQSVDWLGSGFGSRFSSHRVTLARGLWAFVTILTFILFVVAFPVRAVELSSTLGNLSPAQESILRELGVPIEGHARLLLGIEVAVALVFLTLALLIFWRKPADPVATFVSASLVTYIAWIDPAIDSLVAFPNIWQQPAVFIQAVGWLGSQLFLFVFPSGRFVPGWTRYLTIFYTIWAMVWILAPDSPLNLTNPFILPLDVFLVTLLSWAIGIGAQTYRYFRVTTPTERQQSKLVVFAIVLGILGYLAFAFDRFAYPVLDQPTRAAVVYDLVAVPVFLALSIVVPFAFAISILRYRLYQTEALIGRAIVYGTLTAILAGLYSASITLFQRVFIALTGTSSDAAIVLTTLVIASTFTPIKGGLQTVVDKYLKEKPDPTASMRAFRERVERLVEMVDSEQISRRTLDEAVKAFDASGGAVYLFAHQQPRLAYSCGEWNQVEGMSSMLECDGARYGWITVGLRRDNRAYSDSDREVFEATVSLTARSIHFISGWGAELGRMNAQLALPWDTYQIVDQRDKP